MTQLSDGNVPRDARYPIEWSADGESVHVHRDEGGDEQNDVHAFDVETGETRPVIENDSQCMLADVAPDGRLLYGSDVGAQMNLYEYDPETGESRQITRYARPAMGGQYSPDGERIAYVANEREELENRDTYVVDVTEARETPPGDREDADLEVARRLDVSPGGYETMLNNWTPDGEGLLLTDNESDRSRIGVYDLGTDEVDWLSDGAREETGHFVHPDGYVFAERVTEATQRLVVYDRDGSEIATPFTDGVAWTCGSGRESSVFPDGSVLTGANTATTRNTYYRYDPASDETTLLREPEYGDVDPDVFADAEFVTYESTDVDGQSPSARETESPAGTEIEGVLYDSGERPSPAIVAVHGGPPADVKQSFDERTQFLVDRGYTMFWPNFRGSTGRGREFKNAIIGDWGGQEQADIAAGARWIAEKEWIDSDNLAVFGGSYGGYSTYWQLTNYPDLWDAGIAWIGITDLPALFDESMAHFKTILRQYMGDPEENADLWRERSPITHVEDIEAPLLMLHGVNDPRCPIS